MYKYAVGFSKTGTICYTSHLDIMRLFNRVIKRAGIKLAYSHGFNPHPKMVFAQPLSLGYTGLNEYIEIETTEDHEPGYIAEKLSELMPPGLDIKGCERMAEGRKTLAAMTVAAEYMIEIPLAEPVDMSDGEIAELYMSQDRIITLKKQKKKKVPVEIDIKPMIRQLQVSQQDGLIMIDTVLDSGSISNLSPELLIKTFTERLGIDTDRSEMDVTRKQIFFE